MMDEPNCKTCVYYMMAPVPEGVPEGMGVETGQSSMGWCRRYPPTVIWIEGQQMSDPNIQPGSNSFMPAVHEAVWCGEHKAKGKVKVKGKGKK
jgi:hypothetical protein